MTSSFFMAVVSCSILIGVYLASEVCSVDQDVLFMDLALSIFILAKC